MTKHKLNILLPVLLTVIFFVALLIIGGNTNKKTSVEPTPVPSPIVVNNEDEKIENGVYTNYKYGFSFEYPEEIFDTTQVGLYARQGDFYRDFFNKEQADSEGYADKITVSVNHGKSSTTDYLKFEELSLGIPHISKETYINKPQHEWPFWNTTKLKNIKNNSHNGYVLYRYPTGGGEGEPTWSYYASWMVDDKVYNVTLVTPRGQDTVKGYLSTFENIISSFKFIDSVQ